MARSDLACSSASVREVLAESRRRNGVSLPACAFWGFGDVLALCLCEGTLPAAALGHWQAVTRIGEGYFAFSRGG